VERGRKERSPKKVNKKLADLLMADAEDSDAHSTSNSTLIAAPTPDSAFCDGLSEEEATEPQEGDPPLERKCRTCFQVLSSDEDVKDLYERDNIALLYHIEVTTGVWVGRAQGGWVAVFC